MNILLAEDEKAMSMAISAVHRWGLSEQRKARKSTG